MESRQIECPVECECYCEQFFCGTELENGFEKI